MSPEVQPRWPIPSNWVWASLSDLGYVVGGGTPSTKEPLYWGDEINWISPADLTGYSGKTIRNGRKGLSRLGLENSSARIIPAGSIHFSSRAPIGHVVIGSEEIATNQGFKSLVPACGILNSYVYYYLIASRGYARKHASGTTFLELSGKAFGGFAIPVAPSNEQHRIVSKVEELISELDAGIEGLKKARALLDMYRKAVLRHGFSGRFTEQLREKNKDKIETYGRFLDRIIRARSKRYEDQLTNWRMAVDEWKAGPRQKKRPPRPAPPRLVSPLLEAEIERLPYYRSGGCMFGWDF